MPAVEPPKQVEVLRFMLMSDALDQVPSVQQMEPQVLCKCDHRKFVPGASGWAVNIRCSCLGALGLEVSADAVCQGCFSDPARGEEGSTHIKIDVP